MKTRLLSKLLHPINLMVIVLLSSVTGIAEERGLDERIGALSRNTSYRLIESIPLNFDTHHPQGMTIVNEKIYLTSVHAISKSEGKGVGYLFELDMKGKLLRTLELGEGSIYHPGGIDFDGKHIWVSVAEYRPDSSSIVYRVDPKTMTAEEMFRFNDHLGGIVSLPDSRTLLGVSWGSRTFYRWDLDESGKPKNPTNPVKQANGSHFIDYQDGQWVRGTDLVLFGGLAGYRGGGDNAQSIPLGGLALVDAATLHAESEVPVSLYTNGGRVMNQNPFYATSTESGLTLYFIPEDSRSVLYIYTVRMRR